MAVPPEKRPDRHYDFRGLNVVFAWSSLALLLVTVWMIFADYAKPWKRLQSEFRDRERQVVAALADEERQRLDDEAVASLEARIAAEEEKLREQRSEIEELEDAYVRLDKKIYAADSVARGTKSLLDTARYGYDEALQSGHEVEAARAEMEELAEKWLEERKAVELLTEQRESVEEDLAAKRAGLREAEAELEGLRSGLETQYRRLANLEKSLDYFVLNAPVMDFIEPDLKVEQVMLPGLFQDINFTRVDRVDRCVTCHVAVNRPGFEGEEWEEPFRSHPRPDLYLTSSSPHPYARFGCTICHQGLDRATDFARVGHSPSDEEERREWSEEWGWEPQKYLETPIYPAEYSEAGCVQCHAKEVWTPESTVQDVGRELVSRMGCFGCHLIDYPAFEDLPRPGPALNKVASKTTEAWAYRWIAAPRDFHPTTWMPHFFYQENTQTPENLARQSAEIAAIVSYLWEHSRVEEYPEPPAGDATRGQGLFETVGCTGCHLLEADAKRDDYFPQINRLHGPNLVRTGSKVEPGWLYAWLKDPKRYNPDTRMPNLRLSDGEAADLVAYLMSQRDPEYEGLDLPAVDEAVRDDLVLSYLQNNNTIEQSYAILEGMGERERSVFLGEETIRKYGCFACHDLAGFEDAKPIGVELTEEGSKPVHQFDFGHVHDVPHTRHDWIKTKLLNPRIWDRGKEQVKAYGELYKMPNFGMSQREAEAVLVNVLGFTEGSIRANRLAGRSARTAALAEGRKLITRYNCQGCHLLEGEGQAIRTAIEDEGLLPPNLASQGARVDADWLFSFLHDPGQVTLRPWLAVRMPTFGFSDEEVNTLVSYFTAQERQTVFTSPPERPGNRSLVVGRVAFNMLQCAKCHPAGAEAAAAAGAGVRATDLAPSLILARGRLRHDWVPDWILEPQSWIPGTRMPANFAPREDGDFDSPLAAAIDAPMFSAQKNQLMRVFESEEELKDHLADARKVTVSLRDHIWWGLN